MIQVPKDFIKSSLEILSNKYLYLTTDTHFSFNLNMKICMLHFFFNLFLEHVDNFSLKFSCFSPAEDKSVHYSAAFS